MQTALREPAARPPRREARPRPHVHPGGRGGAARQAAQGFEPTPLPVWCSQSFRPLSDLPVGLGAIKILLQTGGGR